MKQIVKKLIPQNSILYKLMQNLYRYKYWFPKDWKNDMLQDYANYNKKARFIQIGSNNGVSCDPINKLIMNNEWQGILIEPIQYLYEELKSNYHSVRRRLIFENCAIANANGNLKFYRLQKSNLPNLPYWYDQIGSFSKEVVLKHADSIPHFDELLVEEEVKAITFTDLMKKHDIKHLDLIQIDTEGHDFEILKTIPLGELKVDFIMFENKHLRRSDFRKAIKMLKKHGYKIGSQYKDTIAVKKEILPLIKEANKQEYQRAFSGKREWNVQLAHS
jgi:FkbM family methyltransferase